jgi:hypothetical protein
MHDCHDDDSAAWMITWGAAVPRWRKRPKGGMKRGGRDTAAPCTRELWRWVEGGVFALEF